MLKIKVLAAIMVIGFLTIPPASAYDKKSLDVLKATLDNVGYAFICGGSLVDDIQLQLNTQLNWIKTNLEFVPELDIESIKPFNSTNTSPASTPRGICLIVKKPKG